MVDKYLNELLSIEVPKKEDIKNEELMRNMVVCLPLRSILLILRAALKNIDKFDEQDFTFTKALSRIEEFIKNDKIFAPKQGIYNKICGEEEKGSEGIHYIILYDLQFLNKDTNGIGFENWQEVVGKLLSQITLEPYFNLSYYADEKHPERSMIEDLLTKLNQYPHMFLIPSSRPNYVSLLVANLGKQVKNGLDITEEKIADTIAASAQAIKQTKKSNNKLYTYLNNIITTLKNSTRRINKAVHQYTNEIIPLLEAERLIKTKKLFKFSIDQVQVIIPANKVTDKATLIETSIDEFSNEAAIM